MGELFSQMTSLIASQSETISRIEDDVESGYVDTSEGHKHMLAFDEVTRGNRSMIIKIFALMVAFIFLFLIYF
jgi:syntaxin 5